MIYILLFWQRNLCNVFDILQRKRAKKNCVKEAVEEIESEEAKIQAVEKEKLSEEEEKKKADSLWAGEHLFLTLSFHS